MARDTAIILHSYRTVKFGDDFRTHLTVDSVIPSPNTENSSWRKPTIDDGTTSMLDLLRSPAVVVV